MKNRMLSYSDHFLKSFNQIYWGWQSVLYQPRYLITTNPGLPSTQNPIGNLWNHRLGLRKARNVSFLSILSSFYLISSYNVQVIPTWPIYRINLSFDLIFSSCLTLRVWGHQNLSLFYLIYHIIISQSILVSANPMMVSSPMRDQHFLKRKSFFTFSGPTWIGELPSRNNLNIPWSST